MNSRLRTMVFLVGTIALAGGSFILFTPQPVTRSMTELRDAGIGEAQKAVAYCPERITPATRRRINANQPGVLRPKQRYATIARVIACYGRELPDGGYGICFRPDGGVAPLLDPNEGTVIIPSLRQTIILTLEDGGTQSVKGDGGTDDAGDTNDVDDSFQYSLDRCELHTCADVDLNQPSPWANACGALNRLWMVQQPCMVPNCWTLPDAGWDDNAVVDCRFNGPYGLMDGGLRWRGCNVGPREYASGAACLPSSCSIVAGDNPFEDL